MEEKHDWHVFIVNARDSASCYTRPTTLLSTLTVSSTTFSSAASLELVSPSDATSHVTPTSLTLVDIRHVEV